MERSGVIELRESAALRAWLRLGALPQAVLAGLGYFGAAELGEALSAPGAHDLIPFWPASGLLLAALLVTPRARWPAVCAGALVGMAAFNIGPQGPVVTAAFEVADLALPLVGASITLRVCHGRPDLGRLRDTAVLMAAGAVAGTILAATIAAAALALSGPGSFSGFWVTLALSNAVGVLLVTPLVVSWALGGGPASARARVALAVLTLLTAAAAAVLFLAVDVPLVWIALILPMVAAVRWGVAASSVTVFPWVVIGVVSTTHGHGVYAASTGSVSDAILYAQASTGTGVLVVNTLGAVAAQLSKAVRRLRRSEESVRLLVEGVRDHAMFMVDHHGCIASWNAGARRMLGHDDGEVVGRPAGVLLCRKPDQPSAELDLQYAGDQERWVRRGDGTTFLGCFASYPARNPGDGPGEYAVVLRDVTESRRAEQELRHMALHDSLTGLPNRSLLHDRLAVALSQSEREHTGVAVLFCDLDRFKVINDSLGHEQGDEVLKQIARRLRAAVRPGDTVARFGGDEFVLCCQSVRGAADAQRIAERVKQELGRPLLIGEEMFASASIGIALAGDGATPDDLIRDADAAMYRAKDRGGGHALVEEADRSRARDRLRGETEIRRALERDELVLHFQPIVDLASGQAVAVEALLRWHHPERGLLSPGEFIRLAEDTGAIVDIGMWVLEEACEAGHRLREQAAAPDLRINVNVSGRQLVAPGFTEGVGAILGRTATNPRGLCLELTETTLIEDLPVNESVLNGLKRIGVQIAMDDFGIGYSSLAYLRRLPIDQLKLDRSFVTEIDEGAGGAPVLRAAVAMAQALEVEVVAEGVEQPHQVGVLSALGYGRAQGFHFARPMPEPDMAAWLREARRPDERGRWLRVVGGGSAS